MTQKYEAMVAIVDAVSGRCLSPVRSFSPSNLLRRALELHDKHGVAPLARFTHVGHNIGLETEEQWLDDRPDTTVKAGMAINIELYTLTNGGNQIGNEETYFVSDSGSERVSVFSSDPRGAEMTESVGGGGGRPRTSQPIAPSGIPARRSALHLGRRLRP